MIETAPTAVASDPGFRGSLWLGLLGALLALSACISESDPRDGTLEAPDGRADSDVREGGVGDAARSDARDISVTEDADDPLDGVSDEGALDSDVTMGDATDADARGLDAPTSDVTTNPDVTDTATDIDTSDADARADTSDGGTTVDASDSGAPIDGSDSGAPGDANDEASDADASAADARPDGGDANDGAADGGPVIFYQENFDSALGTFSSPTNVCGASPPQWSNVAGYAHATDLVGIGVSRISSPAVLVPFNASNVTLRMSHKFDTEPGFDAGQLLISVNGLLATQVTSFTTGGYTTGGQTNPTNCNLTNNPGMYPGWSGDHAEWISEVNLSAAPFNVLPGSTVTIMFRMTTDATTGGAGWDIDWVALSANLP
jgi:hypothetical protein